MRNSRKRREKEKHGENDDQAPSRGDPIRAPVAPHPAVPPVAGGVLVRLVEKGNRMGRRISPCATAERDGRKKSTARTMISARLESNVPFPLTIAMSATSGPFTLTDRLGRDHAAHCGVDDPAAVP